MEGQEEGWEEGQVEEAARPHRRTWEGESQIVVPMAVSKEGDLLQKAEDLLAPTVPSLAPSPFPSPRAVSKAEDHQTGEVHLNRRIWIKKENGAPTKWWRLGLADIDQTYQQENYGQPHVASACRVSGRSLLRGVEPVVRQRRGKDQSLTHFLCFCSN